MADFDRLNVVTNIDLYKISGYPALSAADSRKAIVARLKSRMVVVNGTVVDKVRIDRLLDEGEVVRFNLAAIHEGTALCNGSGDTTQGSYPISAHKTVCFDMVRGDCVTGVNPDWGPDEFYPVGVALSALGAGQDIVPIQLANLYASVIPTTGQVSSGSSSGCCLIPFELAECLDASGCADAFTLEIDDDGIFSPDEMITVCDKLYLGLEGCDGDRGTYQTIGNYNVIMTLSCSGGG